VWSRPGSTPRWLLAFLGSKSSFLLTSPDTSPGNQALALTTPRPELAAKPPVPPAMIGAHPTPMATRERSRERSINTTLSAGSIMFLKLGI